ncbi:uncharacterized protein LOC118477363 isoform X2 [Aplysia californica]|uniref:Uncharacterized protein LOC118477363 isoform X2 n=1 Tax=Aplysia californica TaxID=6500 RepID=A0ABM1VQ64_APLCA|nr:uncharacterized protein LOC118477363 isoform X2 [Aplysia californica]
MEKPFSILGAYKVFSSRNRPTKDSCFRFPNSNVLRIATVFLICLLGSQDYAVLCEVQDSAVRDLTTSVHTFTKRSSGPLDSLEILHFGNDGKFGEFSVKRSDNVDHENEIVVVNTEVPEFSEGVVSKSDVLEKLADDFLEGEGTNIIPENERDEVDEFPDDSGTEDLDKRAGFAPWAGKRDGDGVVDKRPAFHAWSGKRTPHSAVDAQKRPAFHAWSGKRSTYPYKNNEKRPAFHAWSGKRSEKRPAFSAWNGKRSEKRPAFHSWSGKRSEKRPAFHSWSGKRSEKRPAFHSWSGKRSEKRPAFHAWSGKRSEKRPAFHAWSGKRSEKQPAFHAWSGKRSDLENAKLLSFDSLPGNHLEEIKSPGFYPWEGKKQENSEEEDSFVKKAKFHAWGGRKRSDEDFHSSEDSKSNSDDIRGEGGENEDWVTDFLFESINDGVGDLGYENLSSFLFPSDEGQETGFEKIAKRPRFHAWSGKRSLDSERELNPLPQPDEVDNYQSATVKRPAFSAWSGKRTNSPLLSPSLMSDEQSDKHTGNLSSNPDYDLELQLQVLDALISDLEKSEDFGSYLDDNSGQHLGLPFESQRSEEGRMEKRPAFHAWSGKRSSSQDDTLSSNEEMNSAVDSDVRETIKRSLSDFGADVGLKRGDLMSSDLNAISENIGGLTYGGRRIRSLLPSREGRLKLLLALKNAYNRLINGRDLLIKTMPKEERLEEEIEKIVEQPRPPTVRAYISQIKRPAFNAWGGRKRTLDRFSPRRRHNSQSKRPAFSPWSGKRSNDMSSPLPILKRRKRDTNQNALNLKLRGQKSDSEAGEILHIDSIGNQEELDSLENRTLKDAKSITFQNNVGSFPPSATEDRNKETEKQSPPRDNNEAVKDRQVLYDEDQDLLHGRFQPAVSSQTSMNKDFFDFSKRPAFHAWGGKRTQLDDQNELEMAEGEIHTLPYSDIVTKELNLDTNYPLRGGTYDEMSFGPEVQGGREDQSHSTEEQHRSGSKGSGDRIVVSKVDQKMIDNAGQIKNIAGESRKMYLSGGDVDSEKDGGDNKGDGETKNGEPVGVWSDREVSEMFKQKDSPAVEQVVPTERDQFDESSYDLPHNPTFRLFSKGGVKENTNSQISDHEIQVSDSLKKRPAFHAWSGKRSGMEESFGKDYDRWPSGMREGSSVGGYENLIPLPVFNDLERREAYFKEELRDNLNPINEVKRPAFHSWSGKRSNNNRKMQLEAMKRSAYQSFSGVGDVSDRRNDMLTFPVWPPLSLWAMKAYATKDDIALAKPDKRPAAFHAWSGKRAQGQDIMAGPSQTYTGFGFVDLPNLKTSLDNQIAMDNVADWDGAGRNQADKRPAFHSWSGKRSNRISDIGNKENEFNSDLGLSQNVARALGVVKKPAFHSWSGKRSSDDVEDVHGYEMEKRLAAFHAWSGKRDSPRMFAFNSLSGKRGAPSDKLTILKRPALHALSGKGSGALDENAVDYEMPPAFHSGSRKRAADGGDTMSKRPAFQAWSGKRSTRSVNMEKRVAFHSWSGKRNSETLNKLLAEKRPAFHSWSGKRNFKAVDNLLAVKRPAFHSWSGKRAAGNLASLKRPAFHSWSGKRNVRPVDNARAEKRPAFHSWSGKRSLQSPADILTDAEKRPAFHSWSGKRSLDNPATGKRPAFHSWSGKRDFPSADNTIPEKRPAFHSWSGKRYVTSQDPTSLEKRPAFHSWSGKRDGFFKVTPSQEKRPAFHAWSGKRDRQQDIFTSKRPAFHSWSGKRSHVYQDAPPALNPLYLDDGVLMKRPAFHSWSGKRDSISYYTPSFGGVVMKRPAFHSWSGKRAQMSQDASLLSNSASIDSQLIMKRPAFHSWSGKRAQLLQTPSASNFPGPDGRVMKRPAFHSWSGKRQLTQYGNTNSTPLQADGGASVFKRPAFSAWSGKRTVRDTTKAAQTLDTKIPVTSSPITDSEQEGNKPLSPDTWPSGNPPAAVALGSLNEQLPASTNDDSAKGTTTLTTHSSIREPLATQRHPNAIVDKSSLSNVNKLQSQQLPSALLPPSESSSLSS